MSKETAVELLPCLFCGSTAEFGRVNDAEMGDFGGEFIQCTNHGCATSSMLIFPTMADATPLLVEKWNRRAADRELRWGDAAMTVAQWQKRHPDEEAGKWQNTDEFDAKWWRDNKHGWEVLPLVRQSDAQAALAAKDAEIETLKAQLTSFSKGVKISIPTHSMEQEFQAYYRRGVASQAQALATLTAERDALRKAVDRLDYEPLFYFAKENNVSYNALCTAVRAAIAKEKVK